MLAPSLTSASHPGASPELLPGLLQARASFPGRCDLGALDGPAWEAGPGEVEAGWPGKVSPQLPPSFWVSYGGDAHAKRAPCLDIHLKGSAVPFLEILNLSACNPESASVQWIGFVFASSSAPLWLWDSLTAWVRLSFVGKFPEDWIAARGRDPGAHQPLNSRAWSRRGCRRELIPRLSKGSQIPPFLRWRDI